MNNMSNQQVPYASAPPAYDSVDTQILPPSYNPEYIANNNNAYSSPITNNTNPFASHPSNTNNNINPSAYNQGNMYGANQGAYMEAQTSAAAAAVHVVPSAAYNSQANQPLIITKLNPVSVSSISTSDHRHYFRSSEDGSDKCKKLILYGACFWCIAIILLSVGSVMLNDNLMFKRESVESKCSIASYSTLSCTYECNCYTDHNDERHCDTCWGYEYEYFATSKHCDGSILHQHSYDDNGSCPQKFKPIGYSSKCWVVCDKSQFSFSSPSQLIAWSVVLLAFGACCCFCGSGFSCKYACCRD